MGAIDYYLYQLWNKCIPLRSPEEADSNMLRLQPPIMCIYEVGSGDEQHLIYIFSIWVWYVGAPISRSDCWGVIRNLFQQSKDIVDLQYIENCKKQF